MFSVFLKFPVYNWRLKLPRLTLSSILIKHHDIIRAASSALTLSLCYHLLKHEVLWTTSQSPIVKPQVTNFRPREKVFVIGFSLPSVVPIFNPSLVIFPL